MRRKALSKIRAFFTLPADTRRQFGQSLLLLPLISLGLRLFDFKRCYYYLERSAGRFQSPPTEFPGRQALRAAYAVRLAARYGLWRGNCLQRSLLLWWLLRRQGIEGSLHIGVRRQEGEFEAHAWVEWGRLVLNDRPNVRQRFVPFEPLAAPLDLKFHRY